MVGAAAVLRGISAKAGGRLRVVAVLVSLPFAGLAGCGGGSDGVAVRVGHDTTITSSAVVRWMSALAPEHQVPDAPSYEHCIARGQSISPGAERSIVEGECEQEYAALRKRALDLLISAHWLIGAAREQGLRIDAGEVAKRASGSGLPVRGGQLDAADTRLAAEAAVAAASIERKLGEADPVTEAQIRAYYHRNIARYTHAEERQIYLSEGISTRAGAIRLRQALIDGKADIHKNSEPELINRAHPPTGRDHEAQMLHTIFTVKPGVFSQPQPFNQGWSFVKVTHVKPQTIKPLAEVSAEIRARLTAERLRGPLAAFIAGWQAKWKARTDCSRGYVMQRCRQSGGAPPAAAKLPFS